MTWGETSIRHQVASIRGTLSFDTREWKLDAGSRFLDARCGGLETRSSAPSSVPRFLGASSNLFDVCDHDLGRSRTRDLVLAQVGGHEERRPSAELRARLEFLAVV